MLTKYGNMPKAKLLMLLPTSVIILLANIYPYHPDTLTGWSILLALSLPLMLASEFLGDRILKANFVQKLSRPARFAYLMVVMGATVGAFMLAEPLLQGHLAKWGS